MWSFHIAYEKFNGVDKKNCLWYTHSYYGKIFLKYTLFPALNK